MSILLSSACINRMMTQEDERVSILSVPLAVLDFNYTYDAAENSQNF
ncbi:hypothetical protein [Thermaerobacillus caldiproteolyticus]|uniref:Uncharacterized protein n=1 Tax=Thermaerobacillus caldiproteolyticus TaxID=247480 RepID=A0A7V9Z881_9BACL|nr:hypothetical protein [Anoxybacillus caldiproteolyticus]MBA2875775.1 hypothetical protein [Anoxybacillus caldiproteolyticus]